MLASAGAFSSRDRFLDAMTLLKRLPSLADVGTLAERRPADVAAVPNAFSLAADRRALAPGIKALLRRCPVSRGGRGAAGVLFAILAASAPACSRDSPQMPSPVAPAAAAGEREWPAYGGDVAGLALLAPGRDHARQRRPSARGLDVPHRRDSGGGAHPAADGVRGHAHRG